MEELSIKVSIANREYPLKIKKADEARVKRAAKLLDERMKEYEQQYAVNDKFDLVAMCAMQFASEYVNLLEETEQANASASELLTDIDRLVAAHTR